ncbi:mitochondrial carrier [Cryphonectria parasitica EP155]|uniref:Mitochondrial carrier n=1 Tax=Cryphonectria parasitica (strain ATCC 38755 / EP155) TaxID=660469 RepID=A0A9P4Y123_CRYP1|nr:mitochondrial carrier [Cryphonectria parasitica EP155]KAF3764543.1 mitochondrial carrier [Cryphonectria parasitica EP155]
MSDGDAVPDITPFQKMLSATTGSLLTGLTMTPLDVVRVRWQSQNVHQPSAAKTTALNKLPLTAPDAFRPSNLGVTACCREVFFANNNAEVCVVGPHVNRPIRGIECAVEETQKRTFTSTFDGMRKIARNEGLFTLWRGLSPTLLMAVPANMIYFTGYEWLRYDRKSPFAWMDNDAAPLVAGALARVVAATSIGPIELFRTKLQASHGDTAAGHVKDTLQSMQESVRTQGYRSLWRGLSLTLWRDVPFSAMYWWGYESIRAKLTETRERGRGRTYEGDIRARQRSQSQENHRETFTDSFVAGSLSGAMACIATMPFDVGKTRTQVYQSTGKNVAGGVSKTAMAPEEQTMFGLLRHIVKTEGVPGLFRGWMPRVMKVAPACAIMISSFEMGKKLFRDVNERALKKQQEQDMD